MDCTIINWYQLASSVKLSIRLATFVAGALASSLSASGVCERFFEANRHTGWMAAHPVKDGEDDSLDLSLDEVDMVLYMGVSIILLQIIIATITLPMAKKRMIRVSTIFSWRLLLDTSTKMATTASTRSFRLDDTRGHLDY
jgi:hypothetical protein